uniref:hepatitis A virus cellular receptor 1 homolog isoform X3 n=1 Tax=Semicossyphus pulcher TaxID=241346 RepID=UPI0037E81E22
MLSLLLHTLISVCILTVPAHVSAVTTETVVGVAGRRVTLPCRVEVVSQGGVEVCWGRGEPSLFTCHNAVINTAGDQTTYRKSYRYSSSSSSSLSILNSRLSDSGFYHCRAQLPGPFNDQTSTVHLIIIKPHSVVSEPSHREDAGNLNTPQTPAVVCPAARPQSADLHRKHSQSLLHHLHPCTAADRCSQSLESQSESRD